MKRRISFLSVSLVVFLGTTLRATEFDPLSVDQLAQKSELILHGIVLGESCQRDPQGRIYTRIDLQVSEVWKGTVASNRFSIVHGGGILGREKAAVSGQVEYGIGEEVVAFLVLNQRGEGVTLGLSQGKFHVWMDVATGERLVSNPFHGKTDALSRAVSPDRVAPAQRMTLAELKRCVRGGAQ